MDQRIKNQHETIEVSEGNGTTRLKVIRQDRLDVENLNCFIEINGYRQKVFNISSFGLLIVAPAHTVEFCGHNKAVKHRADFSTVGGI